MTRANHRYLVLIVAWAAYSVIVGCACPTTERSDVPDEQAKEDLVDAVSLFVEVVLADQEYRKELEALSQSGMSRDKPSIGIVETVYSLAPQRFDSLEASLGDVIVDSWDGSASTAHRYSARVYLRKEPYATLFVFAWGVPGSNSGVQSVWLSEDGRSFRYLYRNTP